MTSQKDFLSREEAIEALGVKPATLYSYVSRGLIRSLPAAGTHKHLYSRDDIERFAARGRGRVPRSVAAGAAMRWGEPIVNSSITYIDASGPIYRNRSALAIAQGGHPFEVVTHFLITGVWQSTAVDWAVVKPPENVRALLAAHAKAVTPGDIGNLMAMTVLALGMGGRDQHEMSDGTTVPMARAILQMFAGCLGFLSPGGRFVERHGGETLGAYALRASGAQVTPAAVRVVDAVLITLADHELAPATFAARVAASIDTGLCNCIAAAISAHVGYSTGAVTGRVETQLFDKCTPDALAAKFDTVREHGASLYGFNHPLYPHGDPRAVFILACAATLGRARAPVRNIMRFLERVKVEAGATPGIAIGLTVLTRALGMPDGSATALWIIARTAGWVAHVVEQRTQSFMLRPRAKFVGHGSKVDEGSAAE